MDAKAGLATLAMRAIAQVDRTGPMTQADRVCWLKDSALEMREGDPPGDVLSIEKLQKLRYVLKRSSAQAL